MTELDCNEVNFNSSFDEIENSKQLNKIMQKDNENNAKKIDRPYRHFIFITYDPVFEIIGKEYILVIERGCPKSNSGQFFCFLHYFFYI